MGSNFASFVDLLNAIKCYPDFIMFTETWLNMDNVDLFGIVDYKHISVPRVGKKGRGVAIYAKTCWNLSLILYDGNFTSFESCAVSASYGYDNLIVCCVYRPPTSNVLNFVSEFCQYCEFVYAQCVNLTNCTLLIAGDFNINLLQYGTNTVADQFIDCLYSCGLFPTISRPTRVFKSYASLIDNLFVSDQCLSSSGLICTDITDHFPNFACLRSSRTAVQIMMLSVLGLLLLPILLLCSIVCNLSLHYDFITEHSNINDDYDSLCSILSSSISKCLPVKHIQPKTSFY